MSHSFRKNFKKGFSIIELLISITIMMGIISVVAYGQSHYSKTAALTNITEGIATQIRQAQTFGANSLESVSSTSTLYGLEIKTTPEGEQQGSYIYYKDDQPGDVNSNSSFYNVYHDGMNCPSTHPDQTCLEKINLPTGYKITSVCLIKAYDFYMEDCYSGTEVGITFIRPSLGAYISLKNDYYDPNFTYSVEAYPIQGWSAKAVKIGITSPEGKTQNIVINLNGVVEVNN